MDKGISLIHDLFDKNSLTVFFYEEELGQITTICSTTTARPINAKKAVQVNDTDQGIEYLMNYRAKNIKPKQVIVNKAQGQLF